MPRIADYTATKTKVTPESVGITAWETAGRRIGPAYNEAANLERQGEGDIVKAGQNLEKATDRGADQSDKLMKAMLSQYDDLYKIGIEGERGVGSANRSRGAASGGFNTGGGGGSGGGGRIGRPTPQDYGAATEISNGAAALANKVVGNPGPHIVTPGSDDATKGLISPSDLKDASSPQGIVQRDIAESPESGGQLLGIGAAGGALGIKGGDTIQGETEGEAWAGPQFTDFGKMTDYLASQYETNNPGAIPPSPGSLDWAGQIASGAWDQVKGVADQIFSPSGPGNTATAATEDVGDTGAGLM